MNPDVGAAAGDVVPATRAMAAVEEAHGKPPPRTETNTRLVLEAAFLSLARHP